MKRNVVVAVTIFACIGVAVWIFVEKRNNVSPQIDGMPTPTESTYVVPPLNQTYTNDQYRFSVQIPDGFQSQELESEDAGNTVLLQDSSGNGIQIVITPYVDQKILTIDDVRASIPDMQVRDEQSVEIGLEHRGVAFKSNNEVFGGDSREVWFFFRGNLYQISTYGRLDNLLQSMFATWKFF